MITFELNNKFAMLALTNVVVDQSLPEPAELQGGFFASRVWDAAIDETWREALGSLKSDRIQSASLFVSCMKESEKPQIFDDENGELLARVERFNWALLITSRGGVRERPIRLSGATEKSGVSVRDVATYRPSLWVPGTPIATIGVDQLQSAASVAVQLGMFENANPRSRIRKALGCFLEGSFLRSADAKLHQYVRCVEGFIYPDRGSTEAQFKSRTELFVGPGEHDLGGELYRVRSKTEHLHDPLPELPGSSRRDRIHNLYRSCFAAESLAAYCLRRVLVTSDLWQYFGDDYGLGRFWNLEPPKRQYLWGVPLDMSVVKASFDERLVSDNDLDV